jgi:SAM-dependent methyltransferase
MSEAHHTDQDDVFATTEGDRWFERNRGVLVWADAEHDLPLLLMHLYGLAPTSVLEIGAANGYRLAAIRDKYACRVVGVEPSHAAIADGQHRFPGVELHRGRADDVPLHEVFDLVIVNFVFHWVGRDRLLRAVAEVDRLLKNGGLVLLGDFLPNSPAKSHYHHLPELEVFTFKQDYAAIFLASACYEAVALLTHQHASKRPSADYTASDRAGTWLLRKRAGELHQRTDTRPDAGEEQGRDQTGSLRSPDSLPTSVPDSG